MNKRKAVLNTLNIVIILLLLIITICGISAFNTSYSYEIVNQYGESIQMWGAGIYAHDSYFKAPIFIGSDFTILIFIVPLTIITFLRNKKVSAIEYDIRVLGILSILLYYSASLAFGVTYNSLHLVYILLFGLCFFTECFKLAKLYAIDIRQKKVCSYQFTKGMKAFLLIAGIALFVAWLPDIITSIIRGTSLELIEVYTTEITYVLDMGIISPLIFITYYLAKHEYFIVYALLRMILRVCIAVGVMLPVQTIFQLVAGISIPIPALATKVFIFVLLAVFAVFFDYRLKEGTEYAEELS